MHKPRTSWPLETRVKLVVTYQELHKQHPKLSIRQFCQYHQVPYATFARWVGPPGDSEGVWLWLTGRGVPNGIPRPSPGQRSPSSVEPTILWAGGCAASTPISASSDSFRCSLSSLYRVLRRCGALIRRPRRPRPHWQRYAKERPGERAQMDLQYLPKGRYQLTLIDDCTRLIGATVLASRTMQALLAVLPHLLEAFPFPLRCIQTDNGSEFGQEVSRWLRAQGIRHTRIRPRCPHLNGKVERVQRTIQEEYWDGVTAPPGAAWEQGLQRYLRFYNRQRLHSALDYRTPWQYYQQCLPAGAPSLT